tara:strand:+ start:2401 stop:4911 length:2511 start_codon:yes stop_codon:yes gene_type:complete
MDIKQQTKNVAAQGRFGDSMLLHVNPAEVKGLASAMPLTVNPETGQPEAFLAFLAPMLGSLLGPSVLGGLGGLGLSSAALSGIGAGLATYAQTGGSGSKALLSGLTAGMGAKALNTAAADVPIPAADPAIAVPPAPITPDSSLIESGQRLFSGGFDEGMKNLAGAAMTPSGMVAATSAGTAGVIQSQEEFERMLAQMDIDEEERKRLMYERYPEQIPMASGGKTGYLVGRRTRFDDFYDFRDPNIGRDDNVGVGNNPLTGEYNLPARRTARPIPRGFMPGFQPELSYFESINPTATDLGFGQTQGFNSFAPPRRGGFGGLFGARRRPMRRPTGNIMYPGGSPNFDFRGPRFGRPPMFAGYGNPFMQSPSYQGFYGVPQMQQMLNPYARFVQQPMPFPRFYDRPTPPPSIGGPGPGPDPVPDPVPDPTPDPVPDPITPPPNVGGPVPSPKGGAVNPTPVDPGDNFVNPIIDDGIVPRPTPPFERPRPIDRPRPMPIERPRPIDRPEPIDRPQPAPFIPGIPNIPRPRPINRPQPDPISIGRPVGPGIPFTPPPPPSMTIPIEGGSDVTIPINRPQPPISIGGPGGSFDDGGGGVGTGLPIDAPIPGPTQGFPAPQPITSIQQLPAPTGFGPVARKIPPGPAMGGIFGAPMFAEGGDVEVDKLPEGLKAMYDSGPKGREGVEKIAAKTDKFQEGGPTDMMRDPIVQETIQFILGETDNSDIVNEFIVKYGQEQFMILRDQILRQAAGNLDVQTEGLIRGNGNSGMADDLPMSIGADRTAAAVSQDEYIIPADVVSMLGDGSSDAGSKQLDAMLDRVRTEKTGTTKQAGKINPNKVLPR